MRPLVPFAYLTINGTPCNQPNSHTFPSLPLQRSPLYPLVIDSAPRQPSRSILNQAMLLRETTTTTRLLLARQSYDCNEADDDNNLPPRSSPDSPPRHSYGPPSSLVINLNSQGYDTFNNSMPDTTPQTLHNWIETVRATHKPNSVGASRFNRIYIRWQRQSILQSKGDNTSFTEIPWTLVDSKNCYSNALKNMTGKHEIFALANHYFTALDKLIRPAFENQQFSLMREIRYIDPLDYGEINDTDWHFDDVPVFLTAITSWLGPGTQYLANAAMKPEIDNPDSPKETHDRQIVTASKGATLIFYGKGATSKPLKHKSPTSREPRLMIIYRLDKAGKEVTIIDDPINKSN